MDIAIAYAVSFLAMLNPFALFIYLMPVMRELDEKDFMKVLLRASFISFIIFYIFSFGGEFIFEDILQIRFESFRIFGGVVLFTFAFMYIVHGRKSLIELKENLNDLANEIALPFMVGAGTISLAILIGYKFLVVKTSIILAGIMGVNFFAIVILMYIRKALSVRMKVAFDKMMEMSLRLNGFFVGAIGLNMIITGVDNLYFK